MFNYKSAPVLLCREPIDMRKSIGWSGDVGEGAVS